MVEIDQQTNTADAKHRSWYDLRLKWIGMSPGRFDLVANCWQAAKRCSELTVDDRPNRS